MIMAKGKSDFKNKSYFFLKSVGSGHLKSKFHLIAHGSKGIKICTLTGLGHITKMATSPIDGKTPSKTFFSRPCGPIISNSGFD